MAQASQTNEEEELLKRERKLRKMMRQVIRNYLAMIRTKLMMISLLCTDSVYLFFRLRHWRRSEREERC